MVSGASNYKFDSCALFHYSLTLHRLKHGAKQTCYLLQALLPGFFQ
jgi:hypothetical protein